MHHQNIHTEKNQHTDIKAKITITQAIDIAVESSDMTVNSASLEFVGDKPIYDIELNTGTDFSRKLINGVTGDVMSEFAFNSTDSDAAEYLLADLFGDECEYDSCDSVVDHHNKPDDINGTKS
ncbi:hypothetical protein AB835_05590 [Candidatus Endobugula sertula]|uniref:Uncharacterized protein n=1 Tax=Candidatus Endobugula sertula TaxID=62101 RepID=A0A1D2QRC8_9GAMM|nr:hypothetical protein AB835_05590 [Candidatus Endobugula sertula]